MRASHHRRRSDLQKVKVTGADLYSVGVTFTFVNLYIQDETSNLHRKKLMERQMQAIGKVLLPSRVKVSRGEIHIIEERCKQCRLCIELCPKEVLKESEKANEKGYHVPEVVEEPGKGKICVACGFCEVACPEFAIWVEEKKENASEEGGLWEKQS